MTCFPPAQLRVMDHQNYLIQGNFKKIAETVTDDVELTIYLDDERIEKISGKKAYLAEIEKMHPLLVKHVAATNRYQNFDDHGGLVAYNCTCILLDTQFDTNMAKTASAISTVGQKVFLFRDGLIKSIEVREHRDTLMSSIPVDKNTAGIPQSQARVMDLDTAIFTGRDSQIKALTARDVEVTICLKGQKPVTTYNQDDFIKSIRERLWQPVRRCMQLGSTYEGFSDSCNTGTLHFNHIFKKDDQPNGMTNAVYDTGSRLFTIENGLITKIHTEQIEIPIASKKTSAAAEEKKSTCDADPQLAAGHGLALDGSASSSSSSSSSYLRMLKKEEPEKGCVIA